MENVINKYIVFLKEQHQYTKLNISFEIAKIKHPKSIRTIKQGTILWSQEKPFDIEEIADIKKEGFSYQWGFGPCCEQIPLSKLQFAKVENINI